MLLTKSVRKLAGSHAERRSLDGFQMRTASMAKGATVATMSKAAMIRNQWTGKVARRACMVMNCGVILRLGK